MLSRPTKPSRAITWQQEAADCPRTLHWNSAQQNRHHRIKNRHKTAIKANKNNQKANKTATTGNKNRHHRNHKSYHHCNYKIQTPNPTSTFGNTKATTTTTTPAPQPQGSTATAKDTIGSISNHCNHNGLSQQQHFLP